MKQHIPFPSLFFGLLLAGLWGCTDETDLSGAGSDNDGRGTITVSVTDDGYLASAEEDTPATRTQELGYKTIFTAGDQIGLYVVKNNAVITGYDNLCLTLEADGTWTPPADVTLTYEGKDIARYYAYYPYQAEMTGKVTATATDADGFFKPLVDGWTPATDQGNYTKYTSQDLMTGMGTISGYADKKWKLTFSLSHRMTLAFIKTSCTIYEFTNASLPNYIVPPMNLAFDGFAPFLSVDKGLYRFLVKPGSTTSLEGGYTDATMGRKKGFTFTPTIPDAGNYKIYDVDNAVVTWKTHTLQVGDFFMLDGSLVAKDQTLTAEEQAKCIGIVYRIGTGSSDAVENYEDKLTAIHGYVLALQQSSQTWGDASRVFGTGTSGGAELGYKSTRMIMAVAASESKSFPACSYCVNYTPASTGITSGWYYPTTGQVRNFAINANSNGINTQLGKISGATTFSGTYSSSSEPNASQCWGVQVGSGTYYYVSKSSSRYARPVLTF